MVKIAYLILAHKNPRQLSRLCRRLDNPSDNIFIHIDRKSELNQFTNIVKGERIFFVPNRVDVNWGGFSIVRATLNLIEYATNYSYHDYYCLMSGQDYPLKPISEFRRKLEMGRSEYISCGDPEKHWPGAVVRYKRYYFSERRDLLTRAFQRFLNIFLKDRRMYNNLIPYVGSAWWCLTSDCINYIKSYLKENPRILNFFSHTRVSDEMFFQTIIMNSHFKNKVISDDFRHVHFEPRTDHPIVWKSGDFERLIQSEKFFARKFDENIDARILDKLDRFIKKQFQ